MDDVARVGREALPLRLRDDVIRRRHQAIELAAKRRRQGQRAKGFYDRHGSPSQIGRTPRLFSSFSRKAFSITPEERRSVRTRVRSRRLRPKTRILARMLNVEPCSAGVTIASRDTLPSFTLKSWRIG